MADQEIEEMRNRMILAAEADGDLVRQGQPASQKVEDAARSCLFTQSQHLHPVLF